MKKNIRKWAISVVLALCMPTAAQNIAEEIEAVPQRSAGIIYSLPIGTPLIDTPAPNGKKPFYISHYGCSASYYLESQHDYERPIATLSKADSLNMLTPLGKDVLRRLRLVYEDALHRAGELTTKGALQMRHQAQQLVEHFPEAFRDRSYVDGRSIVRNHNILSMQEAMNQISRHRSHMDIRMKSSHSNDAWMDVRDKELEADRFNAETEACFEAFRQANSNNQRLMESLFADADYVRQHINPAQLSEQIFLIAGTIPNTTLAYTVNLYDIFTPQELYQHWRIRNARNYISYGHFLLNGGFQAYAQRVPLRNMLHQGDSIAKLDFPVVHLRYSSRGMLMSLISLIELNGLGLQTANLDQLDQQGWVDYKIAPFGANLLVVYYRQDKNDNDVLVKVILNGQDARLPIKTDCAPYYHWQDMKRYYLRKLYAYEKARFDYNKKKNEENTLQ